MLETKNLSKIYKPKKSVPVTALDGVSLKFSDTGMIFLLGKSGSGKSTLLNLLGGLDKYDDGEIIIKGVSSKSFTQKHFDSYRNTYVGFIFQEYNILEEFTVGANIALALELQNLKATDETINKILDDVDLTGYGNRKPNELSGGQKQRVAIARALVKNPKIIMADEPTGALDSNTGKQIFDTLKKLSKEKLVIVVSHDRDFASRYADRIIELADGKVISDSTISDYTAVSNKNDGITFEGSTAKIPQGYHLTEEDRLAINAYIEKLQNGIQLELSDIGQQARFIPTDQDAIKNNDKSEFKLIKSKLSLKNAFKIGSGGLKHKKFRLVMTVLLSCVAFVLFGLADTFSAYNHIETCTNSIYDTGVTYASLSKAYKMGDGVNYSWNSWNNRISKDDIAQINKDTGIDFSGVWRPDGELFFDGQIDGNVKRTESDFDIYSTSFSGFIEISEEKLSSMGYKLSAGKLPDGNKNEIAISEYICQTFIKSGYYDGKSTIIDKGISKPLYQKITKPSDMVGKTLNIYDGEYKITGIIDTLFDLERYKTLTESQEYASTADQLVNFVLYNEFGYATDYNYTGMIMTGKGFIDKKLLELPKRASTDNSYLYMYGNNINISPAYTMLLSNVDKKEIKWLDGERKVLGEKEVIVTTAMLEGAVTYSYNGNEENVVVYSDGEQISGTPTYDFDTVKETLLTLDIWSYRDGEGHNDKDYKIVGVIDNTTKESKYSGTIVIPDSLYKRFYSENQGEYINALGYMPKEKEAIKTLTEYCYDETDDMRYQFNNPVCYELDTVNEILNVLADVFLYIGLAFAIFASLMLANFIATSISYKKQEIGILRAIGSRSNDVFRIFFAESFIIAMINFVLSCIGVFAATIIFNTVLRNDIGILITVLNFSIRQVLLLFAVSLAVAALASFFPVKKIASKRPIDAIRNK